MGKLWKIRRMQNNTVIYEFETHIKVFIIMCFVKSLHTIITLCLESHVKYFFCLNWGNTQRKAERIPQLGEFPGRDRGHQRLSR